MKQQGSYEFSDLIRHDDIGLFIVAVNAMLCNRNIVFAKALVSCIEAEEMDLILKYKPQRACPESLYTFLCGNSRILSNFYEYINVYVDESYELSELSEDCLRDIIAYFEQVCEPHLDYHGFIHIAESAKSYKPRLCAIVLMYLYKILFYSKLTEYNKVALF